MSLYRRHGNRGGHETDAGAGLLVEVVADVVAVDKVDASSDGHDEFVVLGFQRERRSGNGFVFHRTVAVEDFACGVVGPCELDFAAGAAGKIGRRVLGRRGHCGGAEQQC